MQAAGHLVAAAPELAAGVQHGEHHRHGGDPQLFVHAHRDAPAIVPHRHDVPRQHIHLDMGAVTRQSLVDGVIHDLIYQMMQPPRPGGADIHARAFADGFQPLQHLDLAFVIRGVFRAHHAVFQFQIHVHLCTHSGSLPPFSVNLRQMLAISSMNPVRLSRVEEEICDI